MFDVTGTLSAVTVFSGSPGTHWSLEHGEEQFVEIRQIGQNPKIGK